MVIVSVVLEETTCRSRGMPGHAGNDNRTRQDHKAGAHDSQKKEADHQVDLLHNMNTDNKPKPLFAELGFQVFAVQTSDVRYGYTLGAFHFAGAGIGAVTKAQLIHLGNHRTGPALGFGLSLGKNSE